MLIKGLHMILRTAIFDMLFNFIQPAVTNAGLDSCGGAHYLDNRQYVLSGFVFDQPQGYGGNKNIGQSLADDLLRFRGEMADDAVDRGYRSQGMQC